MIGGLYNRREAGRSVQFARPAPSRSAVVCPGCGGPTYDAGVAKRPRWLCLRATCVFSWGWKLDFAEPLGPPPAHPPAREPAPAMVAIPYSWRGELLRRQAVTWPRRRA